MKTTKIEWTDKTWNPVTGCTKISTGCVNCYAEVMAHRLCAMGQKKYQNGFGLTMHEETLNDPFQWKQPHTIFVCSMSDLFHKNIPYAFLDKVMLTIEKTPQHHYQILTKRAERMADYFGSHRVPANVWLGVTVESVKATSRIDFLRSLHSPIRFLSCEPLLEDIGILDLTNINWVIVGGESGVCARPMQKKWVLAIKEQAEQQGSAFFFKQWGTWGADGVKRNKKLNGKMIDGEIYQEIPINITH